MPPSSILILCLCAHVYGMYVHINVHICKIPSDLGAQICAFSHKAGITRARARAHTHTHTHRFREKSCLRSDGTTVDFGFCRCVLEKGGARARDHNSVRMLVRVGVHACTHAQVRVRWHSRDHAVCHVVCIHLNLRPRARARSCAQSAAEPGAEGGLLLSEHGHRRNTGGRREQRQPQECFPTSDVTFSRIYRMQNDSWR